MGRRTNRKLQRQAEEDRAYLKCLLLGWKPHMASPTHPTGRPWKAGLAFRFNTWRAALYYEQTHYKGD